MISLLCGAKNQNIKQKPRVKLEKIDTKGNQKEMFDSDFHKIELGSTTYLSKCLLIYPGKFLII